MIKFRNQALLIKSLMIAIVFVLPSIIFIAHASSSFTDLKQNEDNLYNKYINNLYNKHFISGYTKNGTSTGKFGPNGLLRRSELAKISTVVKLSEIFGVSENWNSKNKANMFFTIDDKLQYFYGCDNTDVPSCDSIMGGDIYNICNVCVNNGYKPFLDVKEKKRDCALDDMCNPWYSQYIYYASRKGFINGYTTNSGKIFKPNDYIPRIYALKMIIVDDGNIEPEQDERYKRLNNQVDQDSDSCLSGAEQTILNNNAQNTKLLKYALLADKLGLFGTSCEVFNRSGAYTPKQRANFLQQNLTRKETTRYFSLTTSYEPLNIGLFEAGDVFFFKRPIIPKKKENLEDFVSAEDVKQKIINNQPNNICKFNPDLCKTKEIKNDISDKNRKVWDNVSENRIKKLYPRIQKNARNFINQVEYDLGIKLRIAQGLRTFGEQNKLYAKGRIVPGRIVTYAKGGMSYHNYGLAIDVVEIKNGKANYNLDWNSIAKIGKENGFQWGGDWVGFKDKPHFQIIFNQTLKTLYNLYIK